MLNDAVTRYHELLRDKELAESSRAMLDEGLEQAKLIFGGRRLSPYLRPHFVAEDDFAMIRFACEFRLQRDWIRFSLKRPTVL